LPDKQSNDTQLKLQDSYKKVFSGEDGQEVLKDLEDKFYIHKSTYSSGDTEIELSGKEGQRSTVLYIKDWLRGDLKDKQKDLEKANKDAEEEQIL